MESHLNLITIFCVVISRLNVSRDAGDKWCDIIKILIQSPSKLLWSHFNMKIVHFEVVIAPLSELRQFERDIVFLYY